MIIDLHLHEHLFSACSVMSVPEAVSAAQKQGLDAICITNHDNLLIREAEYLRTEKFPIFVGVELFTAEEGEIIAFGLEYLPKQPISAQKFIDYVNQHEGFCFAAHPFRPLSGLGEHLHTLKGLHGLEVFNGANLAVENRAAVLECSCPGLIPVAGSDAHRTRDVGIYATWFPESIATEEELVVALHSGKGRPVKKEEDGTYRFLLP